MERPPAPSGGFRLYWPVIFDRGRVTAPRGFTTREEAVVFATLHLAAERVEIVEALPRNALGKVVKAPLREPYLAAARR